MDSNADKLWKKALREKQKRLKPGECQKFVRLVLDPSCISGFDFGAGLLEQFKNDQLKYVVRQLPERQCILWERSVGQRMLLSNATTEELLEEEWQLENQVVHLLSTRELRKTVAGVSSIGLRLHDAFPDKRHTIVLIGGHSDKTDASNISNALIELQVLQQITTRRLGENVAVELFQLLQRFTKAVAEAPYKQEKSKILHTFKKYLANDKKQCVRVVGTDGGFGRLWQQHLNRLPQVTLEVAEAVIAQYSCPKRLLAEYDNNAEEAINIIAELRIQRGGLQPLQTDRRIGKVLSTKLHTLYNSRDPNALI